MDYQRDESMDYPSHGDAPAREIIKGNMTKGSSQPNNVLLSILLFIFFGLLGYFVSVLGAALILATTSLDSRTKTWVLTFLVLGMSIAGCLALFARLFTKKRSILYGISIIFWIGLIPVGGYFALFAFAYLLIYLENIFQLIF